ncbi:hypothetical protein B0E37_01410 [Streptomyces sp. MH192]|nr:hypothetical protein [Streptomyces sp. MH192]MCF0099801.1 hypothetical protein [Streptomyces sp. MH191]
MLTDSGPDVFPERYSFFMTEPLPSPRPARDDSAGRADLVLEPVGEAPRLRADAVRNSARLLEVAADLVALRGAENLTMEAVAQGAGVGKGTVFRRFGDRAGLMIALLDSHEQELQAGFLTGPPPLGPGAPAVERLRAFGSAVLRHEQAHRDLYLAAHIDIRRRRTVPAYSLRLSHLRLLLREAGAGGDLDLAAHSLLAYLDITLVDHLVLREAMSLERIESGWYELVARGTGAAAPDDR